jgi:hypothetical protein
MSDRDPAENAVHEGSSLDGGDVTLLAQQELVEPAPVRRLIVPQQCGSWWGVEIYAQTRSFAAEGFLYAGFPLPGLVLVEQPSGKMENPNLSYAVGVIQAALYDGLYSALGRAVRIETCTSGWWKKRACGRGNLYKPKSRNDEYRVLTWARQNGYAGYSWDECDAWGIAEAARREVALEER